MNELSRHIEILLLDNDCVIVPGFGGFMAHHRVAEYDEACGLFYPPQRTLGFNPQLLLNDSLLVQSYVEAYDISYPEAVRKIEGEVEEIRQQLSISGTYEFHGIGVITLLADGRYTFEPCSAGILSPSLYALNTFDFALLEEAKEAKTAASTIIKPALPKVDKEEIIIDEEEDCISEENENGNIILMPMLRNIAAVALILILFVLSIIPAGKGSSSISTCSMIDTELISAIVKQHMPFTTPSDTITVDSIVTVPTPSQQTMVKEEMRVQEQAAAEASAADKFTIVLASKVSRSGAEEYTKRLASEGLKESSILEKTKVRKVIYGRYTSKEEAQQALRTLQEKNVNFEQAWVTEI